MNMIDRKKRNISFLQLTFKTATLRLFYKGLKWRALE